MIIMLRDADFSANNLGKIDFKRELSNETKVLLANYSLPLSEKQKIAVDDFVYGLCSSGIYSKITCLLLPCLAANIEEAMVNVITNENMGVLNPTYWSLRNKGLVQSSTTYGTADAITRIAAYNNVPVNDNHYAVFNSEQYEYITNAIESGKQFPCRRNSKTTFYDSIVGSSGSLVIQGAKYGGVSVIEGPEYATDEMYMRYGKAPSLHQINLSGTMFSVRHGDADKGFRDGYSFPETLIDEVGFCGNGNNGIKAHSLYSFGFSLTDEEQIVYAGLAKSLMDVILA